MCPLKERERVKSKPFSVVYRLCMIWSLSMSSNALFSTFQPKVFYFNFDNIPSCLHMLFNLAWNLFFTPRWLALSFPLRDCINFISIERSSLSTLPKLVLDSPSSSFLHTTWLSLKLFYSLTCLPFCLFVFSTWL